MGEFEADSDPHQNISDWDSQCIETSIQDNLEQEEGGMGGEMKQVYSGGVGGERVCSKKLSVDSSMQCDEKEIAWAGSKSISEEQNPLSVFTERGTLYHFFRDSYAVTKHYNSHGGRPSYAVLPEHIRIDHKKRPDLKGVVIVAFDPNATNPARILFESKGLREACENNANQHNKTINAFAMALERRRLAINVKAVKKAKKAKKTRVKDAQQTKHGGLETITSQKKTIKEEASFREETMRREAKLEKKAMKQEDTLREKAIQREAKLHEEAIQREGNF